jgi:hypothetical protein
MRRTPLHRVRTRGVLAVAAVGLVVVGLAACDSGSSKPKSSRTTTTTRVRTRRTTTTTAAGKGTSTTTTTSTTLPTTTVPPTTPTTVPPTTGAGCGSATGPITSAVLGGDLGTTPIASYDLTDCRRSTSQPDWAAVTLRPKAGQSVATMTVVVERLGSIWTIHSYAAGPNGCDAPPPAPAELRLGC